MYTPTYLHTHVCPYDQVHPCMPPYSPVVINYSCPPQPIRELSCINLVCIKSWFFQSILWSFRGNSLGPTFQRFSISDLFRRISRYVCEIINNQQPSPVKSWVVSPQRCSRLSLKSMVNWIFSNLVWWIFLKLYIMFQVWKGICSRFKNFWRDHSLAIYNL